MNELVKSHRSNAVSHSWHARYMLIDHALRRQPATETPRAPDAIAEIIKATVELAPGLQLRMALSGFEVATRMGVPKKLVRHDESARCGMSERAVATNQYLGIRSRI